MNEEIEIKFLVKKNAKDFKTLSKEKQNELFLNLIPDEVEGIVDLNNVSELKIHKILYFLYGIFWARYDEELFKPCFQSWKHGPVETNYWRNKNLNIKYNFSRNNDEKQEYINEILKLLIRFNVWKLVELSHQTAPWIEAGSGKKQFEKMDIKSIKKYFKEIYKS